MTNLQRQIDACTLEAMRRRTSGDIKGAAQFEEAVALAVDAEDKRCRALVPESFHRDHRCNLRAEADGYCETHRLALGDEQRLQPEKR